MAKSHHRKKHKEHLRNYQHSQESVNPVSRKGKITGTFAILGAILGIAIGYFVTDGDLIWIGFGSVTGGLAGYLAGHYLDKDVNK